MHHCVVLATGAALSGWGQASKIARNFSMISPEQFFCYSPYHAFYGTDAPAVLTGMIPVPAPMNALSEKNVHNHFGHGTPMLTPIFMISS
jgi:hypothetical protein